MKFGKEYLVEAVLQVDHDHSLLLMDHLGELGQDLFTKYDMKEFSWARGTTELSLKSEDSRRRIAIRSSQTLVLWYGADASEVFTKAAKSIWGAVRERAGDPKIRRIGVRTVIATEVTDLSFDELSTEIQSILLVDKTRELFRVREKEPWDVGFVFDFRDEKYGSRVQLGPASGDEIRAKYDDAGKDYSESLVLFDLDYFVVRNPDSEDADPIVKDLLKQGLNTSLKLNKRFLSHISGETK